MNITNQADLERVFREVCIQVIDEVTDMALLKIKEVVSSKVYDAYIPFSYVRLGEDGGLLGAWAGSMSVSGNKIEGSVEHDPQMMDYVPENEQHGSFADGDMREYIAMYVEYGNMRGNVGERPFWNFFVQEVGTQLLDTWIKQAFARHGFSVRRA